MTRTLRPWLLLAVLAPAAGCGRSGGTHAASTSAARTHHHRRRHRARHRERLVGGLHAVDHPPCGGAGHVPDPDRRPEPGDRGRAPEAADRDGRAREPLDQPLAGQLHPGGAARKARALLPRRHADAHPDDRHRHAAHDPEPGRRRRGGPLPDVGPGPGPAPGQLDADVRRRGAGRRPRPGAGAVPGGARVLRAGRADRRELLDPRQADRRPRGRRPGRRAGPASTRSRSSSGSRAPRTAAPRSRPGWSPTSPPSTASPAG